MNEAPPPDRLTRLAALVARAAVRARETGRPVLASVVEDGPAIDPLVALGRLQAASGDARVARALGAGRAYWAHPASGLAMAGVGAATTIAPSGPGRFAAADSAWRTLLADALVDDSTARAMAESGPLLLGGFAFEAEGPRGGPWRDFPATRLVVPSLLLTTRDGRTVITSTVLVPPGGTSVDVGTIAALRSLVNGDAVAEERDDAEAEPVELAWRDHRDPDAWGELVVAAVAAISRDEFQKVVLARSVATTLPAAPDVLALLDHLRRAHRDAYVFGIWAGDTAFVGASPERLVRLQGDRVDASSLAGSARRGATPEEDAGLAGALVRSAKDLAEHAMVRTALGEALGTLCDDVSSHDGPELLTLPHVHHLHTAVRATLRPGHSLLDLAGVLHPTPAVGGTPRGAALAFIRAHEALDRGWYAAPVGWIGRDAGELAVALRSALLDGTSATLFAGCGIVAGSEPAQELAESRVKLRPMQSALAATIAARLAVADGRVA